MEDKEVFIQFNSLEPYITHPKSIYHTSLIDALSRAYTVHILPDGRIDPNIIKQIERIIKLLKGFVKEKRKDRMFRFSNSGYVHSLTEIHIQLMSIQEQIRNRCKDAQCRKQSENPTLKPSDTSCHIDQDITEEFCSNLQQTK